MDIERLRGFLMVAHHGHFGRAAEHLNITQPGLTKRIRGLEETLGGVLLHRDRQPILLTHLGRQLLPAAQRLVRDADAFLVQSQRTVAGETGTLAIGFGLSTISLAPQIISKFRSVVPDVGVIMNDFSSREMVDRIRRDELDLGFVRLPIPGDLDMLPLATDQLAVAVPADVPISDLNLEQLRDYDFVALRDGRGPGLASQIQAWCRVYSFSPRVVQEADDIQTVLALVAAGLGCAIVPASAATLLPGQLKIFLLPGSEAVWRVGAAWAPSGNTGALARLIKILQDWSALQGAAAEIPGLALEPS
jgi:DNA-binding transcriptional LysR family regulator